MFEAEATVKFCLAVIGILLFLDGIAIINRSPRQKRAGWLISLVGGGLMLTAFLLREPVRLDNMSKEATQIAQTFAILALLLFAFGFPLLLRRVGDLGQKRSGPTNK
jgi:hypothetical protein